MRLEDPTPAVPRENETERLGKCPDSGKESARSLEVKLTMLIYDGKRVASLEVATNFISLVLLRSVLVEGSPDFKPRLFACAAIIRGHLEELLELPDATFAGIKANKAIWYTVTADLQKAEPAGMKDPAASASVGSHRPRRGGEGSSGGGKGPS